MWHTSSFLCKFKYFTKCYCTFRCKVQGHLARITTFVQFYDIDCVKLNKISNLNADECKVGGVSVGTPLRQVNLTLNWWAFNQFHRSPLSTTFIPILSKIFQTLKGLSHEIDFKNVVKNGQILALIRAAAGFWIFRRLLWFLVEIKHQFPGKC